MSNFDMSTCVSTPVWPPERGDIWRTAVGWRGGREPEIPIGSTILVLDPRGSRKDAHTGVQWWSGNVMGPYGIRWIKVADDDLIPCQRIQIPQ